MSHFIEALRSLSHGTFLPDANSALTECVEAVRTTGKKATLTLTLEIKPNGETATVVVPKVATKIPELPYPQSVFYIGPGATLQREATPEAAPNLLRSVDGKKD